MKFKDSELGKSIINENHKLRVYLIILAAIAVVFIAGCVFFFINGNYAYKIRVKLGLQQEEYWTEARKSVQSWDNCLEKLGYDADVVFFGDSLIMNSNFNEYFQDVKIVNLGLNGDSLSEMLERTEMISAVSPEQIFVLGGINVLRDNNVQETASKFTELIDQIISENPEAEVYVMSILPVSSDVQDEYNVHTAAIEEYNQALKDMADSKGLTFIDVYSLYVKDGQMNMDYSEDGIHITTESYASWANVLSEYITAPQSKNVGNIVNQYKASVKAEEKNAEETEETEENSQHNGKKDSDSTESADDTEKRLSTAWANMLYQMNYDADIVFMGDSITQNCNFSKYIGDKKVINLGCGGDTIEGVMTRVDLISQVKPKQIFLMCGVNQLRDDNIDACVKRYAKLLDKIQECNPDSSVYVESVLPMVDYMQKYLPCSKETTCSFNEQIQQLAEERGMTFIDLYPLFDSDGQMNPDYTFDGVHLSDEGCVVWTDALKTYIS